MWLMNFSTAHELPTEDRVKFMRCVYYKNGFKGSSDV